jgi:hypothetical protein
VPMGGWMGGWLMTPRRAEKGFVPSHQVVTLLMQRTQVRVFSPLACKLLQLTFLTPLAFKYVCACVHGGVVMHVVLRAVCPITSGLSRAEGRSAPS